MKAKVRVLNAEIKKSKKENGGNYGLVQVLDLDTYDKIELFTDDKTCAVLETHKGREGVMDLGWDSSRRSLSYQGFKAAA